MKSAKEIGASLLSKILNRISKNESDISDINDGLNSKQHYVKVISGTTDGDGDICTGVLCSEYYFLSADTVDRIAIPLRSSNGQWYVNVSQQNSDYAHTIANKYVAVTCIFEKNDAIIQMK